MKFRGDAPGRGRARLVATLAAVALAVVGCDSSASKPMRRGQAATARSHGELFDSVAESLSHLERYDSREMLKQVCDRLNQWNLQDRPQVEWKPDPMISDLRDELKNMTAVRALDADQFRASDGWYLQETVWLRDISNVARGDQFDDLAVAQRLFDWSVRNIQLEDAEQMQSRANPHRPHETVLFGRGTAIERAWVFILLARQQGLDVVMLGLADAEGKNVRPWLPALLKGGELYLFDTRLGLAIPGPGGQGVATLAQVLADDSLLKRMDLDDENRYGVTAGDLTHVVAYIEASPVNLSRRMALVESRLTGKHKLALTSPASALAERLKQAPQVAEVRLWPVPFEVWLRQTKAGEGAAEAAAREMFMFEALPSLLTGRVLSFKGEYDGDEGAKKKLLDARPPDSAIDDYRLPPKIVARFKRKEDVSKAEAQQVVILKQGKQSATFWLGVILFDEKDYSGAIDFFAKRSLEANPRGLFAPAARYNLARTYEATGEVQKAIELYASDKSSPQSYGNRLRARWLADRQATAEAK